MTKARRDGQVLLHMAALLWSLADMALLAHCLPFHVRVVFFARMRSADAAARRSAFKTGLSAAWIMPPAQIDGVTADEALRIALSFRILALALQSYALRAEAMLAVTDPSDTELPEAQPSRALSLASASLEPAEFARPFARDGPLA